MVCTLIKVCRAKVNYDHFVEYCNGEKFEECEHFRDLKELYLKPSVWKKVLKEVESER